MMDHLSTNRPGHNKRSDTLLRAMIPPHVSEWAAAGESEIQEFKETTGQLGTRSTLEATVAGRAFAALSGPFTALSGPFAGRTNEHRHPNVRNT